MSAIFGFVGFEEDGLLQRMSKTIAHRGPNGETFFQQGRTSIGMRTLCPTDFDLSPSTLCNTEKTLVVSCDSSLLNAEELIKRLTQQGHVFQTQSDHEIILHAYEEWGKDCVPYLNGAFVFVVHDLRSGDTFFARDYCGQKPFYFWNRQGKFIFASEVKAILESTFVERVCNVEAIDAYLGLRYVPEPQTMFQGIVTLPAAHYLILHSSGEIKTERYWDITLKQDTNYPSDTECLAMVESQIRESIHLSLARNVSAGAYLSGGIDSSVVVALMREQRNSFDTYSIGFNSPIDETAAAAETARLLGTTHHEVQCTPEDFNLLPKVIYQMDRPIGDALIIAFDKLASAVAKDHKVVLSGEGPDELFGGYSFHKVIQLAEKYHKIVPGFMHQGIAMPFLKGIPIDFLNRFFVFPAKLGREGKNRFVDFMGRYTRRSLFENYVVLKTLWDRESRTSIYSESFRKYATDAWIPKVRDSGGHFLDRLLKLQWDEWVQDWSGIRQDKNTMAHSLEARMPFLDRNMTELAFRLPPHLKNNMRRDKIIERRLAEKLLPPEVVNRKKQPFYLPMEFFFEHSQIKELIRSTLHPDQIKKRGYFDMEKVAALLKQMESRDFIVLKQIMSLVILELWHQVFIDKQTP